MDASGLKQRSKYRRAKRGSDAAAAPAPAAQAPAPTNVDAGAGTAPAADAAGAGGVDAATATWSHDPGAMMGGLFQRHGRKLFWVGVIAYFAMFTDVPVTKIASWGVMGILGLLALMLFRQDSMLYHPVVDPRMPRKPPAHVNPKSMFQLDYEEVHINVPDGVTIHAWLIFRPGPQRRTCHTLVFFHGNAGSILNRLPNYKKLVDDVGVNILAVEYRGFGGSTGTPSEAGLKLDGKAAIEFLHTRPDVHRGKIVLFGRSLGGAVAVAAAAACADSHPVRGLIIENSFTSVADMAKAVLPIVRLLGPALPHFVRNKWESAKAIKSITAPMLFLSAAQDQLVPPAQMRALHDAAVASTHKDFRLFHGCTHNDMFMKGGAPYYDAIRRFLDTHCGDGSDDGAGDTSRAVGIGTAAADTAGSASTPDAAAGAASTARVLSSSSGGVGSKGAAASSEVEELDG